MQDLFQVLVEAQPSSLRANWSVLAIIRPESDAEPQQDAAKCSETVLSIYDN